MPLLEKVGFQSSQPNLWHYGAVRMQIAFGRVRRKTAPALDWRNWLRINGVAEFLAVFVVNHLFITRCFRYREVDGHHARP